MIRGVHDISIGDNGLGDPDGRYHLAGEVVKAQMGQGGYLSGAKQIAVPLIAVAFESSDKRYVNVTAPSQRR